MRTSAKLAIAWPALLKLAEQGSVTIFYRGVDEWARKFYVARNASGAYTKLLTEFELLDWLMKEGKEAT